MEPMTGTGRRTSGAMSPCRWEAPSSEGCLRACCRIEDPTAQARTTRGTGPKSPDDRSLVRRARRGAAVSRCGCRRRRTDVIILMKTMLAPRPFTRHDDLTRVRIAVHVAAVLVIRVGRRRGVGAIGLPIGVGSWILRRRHVHHVQIAELFHRGTASAAFIRENLLPIDRAFPNLA